MTATLIKSIILFGLTVMFTVLCFKAYDPKKDNGMGFCTVVTFFLSVAQLFNLIDLLAA